MIELIKLIQQKVIEMDKSNYSWGEGVALWGLNRSTECVENPDYISQLEKWVEYGICERRFAPTVNTSIPCIGIGQVYKATGNIRYLNILEKQAYYLLNDAPRLKSGAIIHSDPNVGLFGRQMWADTVFMAGLFLVYMGELTGKKEYIDEALKQLEIHMEVLQDKDGLIYHAWDESTESFIGCKWGRANAWMSIAIVEMLEYIPDNSSLLDGLRKQLSAAAKWQLENGLWRTVIDGNSSYPEASTAYGLGYTILKGFRSGILDDEYLSIVKKMHKTLVSNVDKNGVVNNISAGTPVMRNEAEYNIICQHRMQPWGQGLALMYFTEVWKAMNTSQTQKFIVNA